MGLDNKLIFPDFQTLTLDKDNPTAYYTREASGEIYRIDGRSEVVSNSLNNVGILNMSTNKYDINITSSKNYTLGLINEGDYDVYVDTKYNNYYIKNIPVVPNSRITITKGSSKGVHFTVYKYNANKVEGYGEVIGEIYASTNIQTISIPPDCESITLIIRRTTEHPTGVYIQEGDKFVDYVQTSTKTISIEQPLRQANNNVYDSIYRFGDGGYYLFKRVGVRPYQDGDYDNPLVITDGVNTNYDLGIADYTEVQLTDFDPSIDFFGTDTTFSCDSMMPSIEVKVPIDYAYNESKRKYVDEEINIDTVDVDSRKNIEIVSIEGQTYENLLQEPLVQGTAINPVELTGRECVYTGGENRTVPLREITGDTYINLLEDKIECTTLPLSTTAYIKPNTKYTMFMNTDCDVNYNLGGIEKEYKPTQGKILITTPSTLSNNTLTLLGEGNIGNVTLLEGDYTNSYVPDTFINDVFSVGELQEDGSYKVDIVSKNKNLFVLSMDSIYDTFYVYNKVSKEDAVVIDNEEKTITFNGTDATQGIKVKNRLKKGHTYTIRFKIKWNSGRAGYRIPFVNLVDSLGYKNPNEDSSRLNYSLGIDQDNVYVEVCKTFTLDTDRYLYLQMTTGNRSLSSMTVKDLEIIEGDIIDEKYSEGKEDIISISLPQPLRRVGDVCDRFYWDNTKGKMCIEKNIIPINHAIQKEGINLSYIGSGDGCGVIHYNINGISDLKVNSRIICNKFTSFNSKYELLTEGREKGVEGIHSDDGDINTAVFSFNRNRVKNLDINTIAQWFSDNNVIIQYYITSSPKIIETDITEPIEIDIFDTDTTITTTSTVNPNMYLKSDILSRPVTIKPSTKYYVYANTTGDIEVSLGGAKIQYTSSDIVKEITTPSNISENIIGFVGDCEVSNVMLRTDNRTDIKYFNGVIYASILQDDGNYKTTINIMSNNSEEYDSFINIITSSPLESGSKIVVVDNEFKLLKANGEYEDIVSTDGNVIIDSNCKKICSCGEVNGITSLIVPYRSVRPLKSPINISFNNYTDNDNHTFVWDTDVGVEGHKFYYKDELVATIDSPDPTYTYPSEMEGDVKIVAFNTLTESKGAVEDIITLPNRSEVVALNTIYDNGYKFTIDFNDNSNIRKGYKFIYSVDDGEENIIDIPVSDKAITLSQNIDVSEVSNNMKVRINSYNSVGEAEMKEKIFYLTPTPKWAYLLSSDNLMFRHQDKFPFTTYYKIKATNTQTLEENEYSYGSNQGINGLIIDYLLKSNREEELSVMLTMNDGYLDHIPCVPFKVSKTLDLSLVAPQNFTMEWVGDGIAKFSWDDNYTNEDYFEFVYSLNGGIEEVVKIYPDDVVGTGGRVSYTYKFDGFGILTGRVRMVWELNTSDYTDSKTATFVAVTGLPPAWIVKEYSGDNLVITWEAQSYVDHYEIMIECDGEVEILTEKKDMFYLDLKKYHGKYVSISIKTHFTTGLVTEYSDSILFKPVSTSGITNQMTYAPIKVEKDDNVSVYTKLADRYTSYQRITGLITNSNLLYNKFCKDMLTNSASFNNVFYHLVNHEYKDFVSVKTDNVSIESLIRILNYAHINQDGHLNTFVYTPITSSHTDFVDIQKVTIVCIGDSITSGHPGFWE